MYLGTIKSHIMHSTLLIPQDKFNKLISKHNLLYYVLGPAHIYIALHSDQQRLTVRHNVLKSLCCWIRVSV